MPDSISEVWARFGRPLEFARGRDFANLSVVKDLEGAVLRGLPALQAAGVDVAPLRALATGIDAAPLPQKRERLEALLRLIPSTSVHAIAPAPSKTRAAIPPAAAAPSKRAAPRAPAKTPASSQKPSAPPPAAVTERASVRTKKLTAAAPRAADVLPSKKRMRPAEAQPGTPLSAVIGVGPKTAVRLESKGLVTVQDALFFLPRRYEDRTRFSMVAELAAGQYATVRGEVVASQIRMAGPRKRVFELAVSDGNQAVSCRFFRFSQNQMEGRYPRGTQVIVSGPVTQWGAMRQMIHPDVEVVTDDTVAPAGIVPVYADIEGVPAKTLRKVLGELAEAVADRIEDPLPAELLARLDLSELAQAVRRAHLPAATDQERTGPLAQMRRRLVFDELFFLQLALARTRNERDAEPGLMNRASEPPLSIAARVLPFDPTAAQAAAILELAEDMASPRPMNRLLQGDVGSGKTAVAFVAAAIAKEAGRQSVLLVPTEILAEQHHDNARRMLVPAGVRVALLTGSTKAKARRELLVELATGEIDLLVGTHAVLEPDVVLADLGLAIVDEQHRFGVEQRGALRKKRGEVAPDVLVMTATPIPRTLALTAYGDLRVTVIDELPPGRAPTHTRIFRRTQASVALDALHAELLAGRQAYVVFPLIEKSEKLELQAATEAVHALRERFAPFEVALLHGRLSSDVKVETMRRFAAGEIAVLASTTVIEVGVDVANAAVMLVQDADRFGLGQLHQLRGRVGRGGHPGLCLLISSSGSADAWARLSALEACSSGFEVAEKDLELRGPGEVLGTRQSGLPDLALADLVQDARVVELARREAFRLIEEDPELGAHPALLAEVERRFASRLSLASVA